MDNDKVIRWAIDIALLVFFVLEIATRDDITWISVVFWALVVVSVAYRYLRKRGRRVDGDGQPTS